jgi:uncharacterized protein DUF5681
MVSHTPMSSLLYRINARRPSPERYVGYGRPPAEFRFRPGISGNPGGRPRNARRRFVTDLLSALSEQISRADGECTKQRAIVDALVEKALKGDAHAIAAIINLTERVLGQQDTEETEPAEDRAILRALGPPQATQESQLSEETPDTDENRPTDSEETGGDQ